MAKKFTVKESSTNSPFLYTEETDDETGLHSIICFENAPYEEAQKIAELLNKYGARVRLER